MIADKPDDKNSNSGGGGGMPGGMGMVMGGINASGLFFCAVMN
jgi:hypothetical protein